MEFGAALNKHAVRDLVSSWIKDDIPSTIDIGGLVVGSANNTAHLYMKQSGVFAGRVFFEETFNAVGCKCTWVEEDTGITATDKFVPTVAEEGKYYEYGGTPLLLAVVTGPVNLILRGERTALCALSRCSGVATDARAMVEVAKAKGWKGAVAGTRKTTPGFRIVEKFGLLCGGADTHRLDLSHMVMLKDNHIWACGNITTAVKNARRGCGFSSKIEVECRNLEEAIEASTAGADVIMLDNYTHAEVAVDAPKLKAKFPHVLVEASGGVTIDNLEGYLDPNVDVVSCGKLTQGYACLDYSLKIQR